MIQAISDLLSISRAARTDQKKKRTSPSQNRTWSNRYHRTRNVKTKPNSWKTSLVMELCYRKTHLRIRWLFLLLRSLIPQTLKRTKWTAPSWPFCLIKLKTASWIAKLNSWSITARRFRRKLKTLLIRVHCRSILTIGNLPHRRR